VRLAGYAPPTSTHSTALDVIGTQLEMQLGGQVNIEIEYNILEREVPAQTLLDELQAGDTTLCYFSTSYLADRVPELSVIDLPYIFGSLGHAHAALDGQLGAYLSLRTERATGLRVLGYWDNGFRHFSNRSRPVRHPHDCRGLRTRLQPNWAHEAYSRELGAVPVCNDLREGIAMLQSGELQAQENPLANFVAYGIEALHPHLTLTGHVYGARGVYGSAVQLEQWPRDAIAALRGAVRSAILHQRTAAERVESELRERLRAEGTVVTELTAEERAQFELAAEPVLAEARRRFDDHLWDLLDDGRHQSAGVT